jgi:hypothetical protein
VVISTNGLLYVWLAVEKTCESIKASGETIEIIRLVIIDRSRRAFGASCANRQDHVELHSILSLRE